MSGASTRRTPPLRCAAALLLATLCAAAPAAPAMVAQLSDVPRLSAEDRQRLAAAGIHTPQELLDKAATPHLRLVIEERSGIRPGVLLEWASWIDLTRVDGVDPPIATLLTVSGVGTVRELAHRPVAKLRQRLANVNASAHLVAEVPSQAQVAAWVAHAKTLPRVLY